jgi:hypothetical protein
MLKIDNNFDLHYVRGDTDSITITCADDPFSAGDAVRMSISKSITSPRLLFYEVTEFTNGAAVINIGAETGVLSFGTYYYDIEITRANGNVQTPVRAKFNVLWEVTY